MSALTVAKTASALRASCHRAGKGQPENHVVLDSPACPRSARTPHTDRHGCLLFREAQALFAGHLSFDEAAALIWARLMAEGTAVGQPRSALDMMIAAVAEANHCVVVTDNLTSRCNAHTMP